MLYKAACILAMSETRLEKIQSALKPVGSRRKVHDRAHLSKGTIGYITSLGLAGTAATREARYPCRFAAAAA